MLGILQTFLTAAVCRDEVLDVDVPVDFSPLSSTVLKGIVPVKHLENPAGMAVELTIIGVEIGVRDVVLVLSGRTSFPAEVERLIVFETRVGVGLKVSITLPLTI